MKTSQKLISLLLVFVMIFCLASCSLQETFELIFPVKGIKEDNSLGYTEVSRMFITYNPLYIQNTTKNAYDALDTQGKKELYNMLEENVYYIYNGEENLEGYQIPFYKTKQVVLDGYKLTESDVRVVIKALTDDNSDIFWTSTTFGYLMDSERNYTAVQLYSYFSAEEVKSKLDELSVAIDEFYLDVPQDYNNYQLEKYTHDYIIDNCDYDTDISSSDLTKSFTSDSFSIYGTLVNHKAVCEGYSRTFKFLTSGLGLNTINIIGDSHDQLHMWNAITLGNDWYYVDVTWDDSDEEFNKYDYFNINEEVLLDDHVPSPVYTDLSSEEINGDSLENDPSTMNIILPSCEEMAYNYYVRTCAHLTDYDGEALITSLFVSASEQRDYCQIYIDPEYLDFNDAVDNIVRYEPMYITDYVDKVNNMLSGYKIDIYDLSYIDNEKLHTLTIFLNYI